MFLLLSSSSIFNALFDTTHLITSTPSYHCLIPSLHSVAPSISPHLIPEPFPNDTKKKSCFRYDLPYDRLKTSILSDTENDWKTNSTENMLQIMNVTQLNSVPIIACDDFIYEKDLYTETASTYFNLVCDRDWIKMYLIQIGIIGLPIITPLMSLLSDR